MTAASENPVGRTLAGYRIERMLGRGGMSVVYLAEDLRLERKVALKVLVPDLAADHRFRERVLRESRIAASLDHSHVIPIYEAGKAEDLVYIAMRVAVATVALAVPAVAADTYIPGVTDFPRAEQTERYVPGVTDFPSRAHEMKNGGLQRYVPGVTDFPSYVPESPVSPGVEIRVTDGFDWIDAGFGAAVGVALGALAGVLLLAMRRRAGLTTA